MNTIGRRVEHKYYGEGIIEQQQCGSILVCFGTIGEPKHIRFTHPDAFIKELLTTADSELASFIKDAKENHCKAQGGSQPCSLCGQRHLTKNLKRIEVHGHYLYICHTCAQQRTFECAACKQQRLNINQAPYTLDGQVICNLCYDDCVETCELCGRLFIFTEDDDYDLMDKTVYLCHECKANRTFICSSCEEMCPISELVESKYISKKDKICQSCADECSACHEAIPSEQAVESFGRSYCPTCWEEKKIECDICDSEFISEQVESTLCPDCMEARTYIEKLRGMDFSHMNGLSVSYSELEYIDRCELFTNLYRNNVSFPGVPDTGFHYLVMTLYPYHVVIMYLGDTIGRTGHSANVTMTEFRKNKGAVEVREAIEMWSDIIREEIRLREGQVKLLAYPVLLRVQTKKDKIYGKQWNGPYDYIEIGNYGDTTDFYIIGTLETTQPLS